MAGGFQASASADTSKAIVGGETPLTEDRVINAVEEVASRSDVMKARNAVAGKLYYTPKAYRGEELLKVSQNFFTLVSKNEDASKNEGPITKDEIFTEDRSIKVTKDSIPTLVHEYIGGVAVFAKDNPVKVEMAGHNLNIQMSGFNNDYSIYGIYARNQEGINITNETATAGKKGVITMSLDDDQSDIYGIYAGGDAKISIDSDVTITKVRIRWGQRFTAIDAYYDSEIDIKGKFTMRGTDITKDFSGPTQTAVSSEGKIHIHSADIDNRNGGQFYTILLADTDGTISIDEAKIYADGAYLGYAKSGSILNINTDNEGMNVGNFVTDVQGNVCVSYDSKINIGIKGETSKWVGTRVLRETKKNKFEGILNVYLADKGTWQSAGEKTSVVDKVISTGEGGTIGRSGDEDEDGRLDIKKLSGKIRLIYDHDMKGEETSDYIGGDTHINAADPGAEVTVLTDKTYIDMSNEQTVRKVLTALAGKVYYDAYKNNENNLIGKVGIAEGLLSTSQVLKLGNMTWRKDNGQGEFQSILPVEPGSGTEKPIVPGSGDHQEENPNIPDFEWSKDEMYRIYSDGPALGLIDKRGAFKERILDSSDDPEHKDFTFTIQEKPRECDPMYNKCTMDKKYELIKKIKGKEVYGGVGIMARKKDVSIDLGTNSCEIEVHPYPLKQNIYGILAKNNKMLHMGYKKETSSYKNTDQEYSKEMEFAKTSKVTLSLDNSQADSGNVYGIRAN